MTDPQRRAVEIIDYANSDYDASLGEAAVRDLREANLVILDRDTVAAAVAVAKSFTPRWTEYECFREMQDALGGDE